MKTRPIPGTGISGYEFRVNFVEMETIASLNERAAEVCESFKTKPSYFTKEECQLIRAILSAFVEDYKRENENAFLNKLKEQTEEKKDDANDRMQRTFEAMAEEGVE